MSDQDGSEQAIRMRRNTHEAASAHVALLIPRLRLVRAQRGSCEQHIEALLARLEGPEAPPGQSAEPGDVQILRSLGRGRGSRRCDDARRSRSAPGRA